MRSFIKARLNKDNFWNLMFFLGMFIGVAIAFATDTMILSWVTIVGVIWLVKINSDITFNKDKLEFVINGNKKIKTSGKEFILLMFASFGVMALVGFILDSLKIDDSSILLAAMMSLLIFLPALYCILRNLPIAVYFKKEAWIAERCAEPYSSSDNWRNSQHHLSTTESFMHPTNAYRDPRNSFLQGNIYHRK
ncbi:hypothetical protein [Candidatus Trichorickettsia mobilis]|uniref:hypothetical protein n=1 Tax=Candidatus Trichorickettsia mobilis TaxID=1346319 RepID=UPI002B257607|nr:hypothetical protein [Candidatus Trichorickettsia mobilis]